MEGIFFVCGIFALFCCMICMFFPAVLEEILIYDEDTESEDDALSHMR
jgi:hypothetical protein